MRVFLNLIIVLASAAVVATVGTGCSKQAKAARHMERAEHYYAAGDYDHAEIEYLAVLQLEGNAAPALAYGRIGAMAFEQGRLNRAYHGLLAACQKDTNNVDFHTKLGQFYVSAGKQKEARDEANLVLNRQPDNLEAPLLLVDASITPAELDAAEQRLAKLSVAPAKRVAIESALGNLAFRKHDLKSAAAAYERARALDPKFGPLYFSLGIYYWSQKDLQHADEAFKHAIEALPARSQVRLRYAQFKVQTGDLAGGKKILEETSKAVPDYLPALLALSEIAANEKKYDDASAYLDKVLARDAENYEAMTLVGRESLAQGNSAKAEVEFEKLTRAYPKSYVAFYQLGLACNAANDIPKAITSLNQALTLNPGFTEAALALAQIRVARSEYSAAVISLRQLVQQRPQLATAQLLLAESFRGLGNLDEAVRIYRQLEESYPTNAQVPLLLGSVLLQQNRRDQARKEFSKSLDLAPGYLNAMEKLTDLEIGEKQYSVAMERLQTFIEKNPTLPDPNLLVAKVYLAQNDLKQASAVLNKTIDAHPDYIMAYIMLANAYNAANQLQPALEVVHRLLTKYPDQPSGVMLLAMISDISKDYKTARDAYEKSIQLNPNNSTALNNLACLYSDHGEIDKAAELARRARELLPRDPYTADTLGWILYKRGDYSSALTLLQDAAQTLYNRPDIQLHLGLIHYIMGDEDAARASLKFALASKQDFPDKTEASRCLDMLAIDAQKAGPDVRAALEKQIAQQPGDVVALSRLAAIYKRDGKVDKALSTYEAALKTNPNNAHVLTELARIYASQPNQINEAFANAKKAYKTTPDDPEVSRLLGRLAYATGDYKWSYDLLKQTARNRPDDAELLFDLAQAAYCEGRVDEAQSGMRNALQGGGTTFSRAADARRFLDFVPLAGNSSAAMAAAAKVEQALQSDPAYLPALMAMGMIEERKADLATAEKTYEKVLNRYPDFVLAKERLAILGAQLPGDDQRAYQLALQARDAFPDDPELAKALGIITYRLGDNARAATYLKESAARKNGDAQLMYYLGMAEYKLHNPAESKKSLSQAIQLNLPDQLKGEARRVLAELK